MKKRTVLLADRHMATLDSIRGLLKTKFNSIVMVSDEKSLIEMLPKINPDLVLLDQSFQVSRAPDVVALMNEFAPGLKVIVLSTYEEPEYMQQCMSSGASGYILKRSAAKEIIQAIENVLRGETYISLNHRYSNKKDAQAVKGAQRSSDTKHGGTSS
jgi:DNA-binding NarL/FixJ family response regulator